MSTNVFNGVEGFSGFFEAFRGDSVSITFSRSGSNNSVTDSDEGFLVQSYTAQWGRPVQIDHVLNRTKPVILLGAGQGTLQVVGLVGTAEGMDQLLQSNEMCTPLTAVIRGAATFQNCDGQSGTTEKGCIITLGNVVPQAVSITGNSQNQGINLQSATAAFVFGSLKINTAN